MNYLYKQNQKQEETVIHSVKPRKSEKVRFPFFIQNK